MREQEITESLKHELTETETAEYGRNLAAAEQELANIAAEEKEVKDGFKSRKSTQDKQVDRLTEILGNRYEMRETPVVIVFNQPEHMKCEYVRKDTGEVYKTRDMSDEENTFTFDYLESDVDREDK
jgi:septal ring factor EnvC (AmiA/AmiB activator)